MFLIYNYKIEFKRSFIDINQTMSSINNKININPNGIKFRMGCSSRNTEGNNVDRSNQKTRLCKNANKPGGCKFGVNCHYAHEVRELRIMDCAYKDSCVFIEYHNGCCLNKKTQDLYKTCFFRHPGENDSQYHLRVEEKNTQLKCSVVKTQPADVSLMIDSTVEFINDSLIPIQLDIGLNSWSKVVRNTKKTFEKTYVNIIPKVLFSAEELVHGDEKSILSHVKGLIEDGVTEIKFRVCYD
jgi:hypothetical protein